MALRCIENLCRGGGGFSRESVRAAALGGHLHHAAMAGWAIGQRGGVIGNDPGCCRGLSACCASGGRHPDDGEESGRFYVERVATKEGVCVG